MWPYFGVSSPKSGGKMTAFYDGMRRQLWGINSEVFMCAGTRVITAVSVRARMSTGVSVPVMSLPL